MKTGTFLAALILVCLPCAAQAKLVKCKTASGRYVVQDVPCAPAAGNPQARQPVIGEKDPSFLQKGRPSANWERTAPVVMDAKLVAAAPAEPFSSLPSSFFASAQQKAAARDVAKPAAPDYLERKAEEERLAYNEQAKARSKKNDCDYARRQAEVTKTQRAIYTADSKGERHYVDDQDRSKVVAQAEREANLFCSS